MTNDNTSTEALQEAQDLLRTMGSDDLADKVGEDIDGRYEEIEQIVRMKELAERAEDAGLADDPAVEALREHANSLAEESGLVEQTPKEQLVENHNVSESALGSISEDDHEALLGHMEAIEELEQATARGVTKVELGRRRDRVADLLDTHNVSPDALLADKTGKSEELEAALAADYPRCDVTKGASERVQAAELRDTKEELEDELAEATTSLRRIQLEGELEDVEAELADLE